MRRALSEDAGASAASRRRRQAPRAVPVDACHRVSHAIGRARQTDDRPVTPPQRAGRHPVAILAWADDRFVTIECVLTLAAGRYNR